MALSTTEAENMAIVEAIKEAIWIRGLINNLGIYQKQVKLHCDSRSAIHLSKYQGYHSRTKHFNVRFHFIHDILFERKIIFQKVPTTNNSVDMLTNVVRPMKFEHCLHST